jgi:hypothetical protein
VLAFGDDVFVKEMSKFGVFEPISVSTKFCKDFFGIERLSASEALPENFLKILVEKFGANGVLFIDLHSFKPYRPLSLGVRAKLVDLKSGEFMWAIDETIDTGEASVMVAANLYQRGSMSKHYPKKPRAVFFNLQGFSASLLLTHYFRPSRIVEN